MDDRFEIYNPEIDGGDDGVSMESLTYGDDNDYTERPARPSKPRKGKPEPRRRGTARRGKNAPSTRQPKKETFASKLKRTLSSTQFRILLGITFGLLAVYLLVAFISFLSAGFHDQSEVLSKSVGAASDIANSAGETGARMSNFLIDQTFGIGSVVIVLWLAGMAMRQFGILRFKTANFTLKCVVATISLSLITGLATVAADSSFCWGGVHGLEVNKLIIHNFGWIGAALLCVFAVAVFVVICLDDLRRWLLRLKHERDQRRKEREEALAREEERRRKIAEMHKIEDERTDDNAAAAAADEAASTAADVVFDAGQAPSDDAAAPSASPVGYTPNTTGGSPADPYNDQSPMPDFRQARTSGSDADTESEKVDVDTDMGVMTVTTNEISASVDADDHPEIYDPTAELSHYKFPTYNLLRESSTRISVDQNEQLENQNRIRKTLLDFGIPIVSISATVGPTVTLYEIVPDKGVKISKIRSLVDDIALSLSAIGVRIIAPIPGKGTVGIEVANKDPQVVSMRSIITSRRYQENRCELPVAIGSTINNQVYIADLAKMPHLLVAGATGQGKSVGLNAIIASLLYSKHPAELKFVLVDPKMVEFSLYSRLEHHYLAKLPDEEDAIITNRDKVVVTLRSLCKEMDDRYVLLKAAQVRNIKEYNAKFVQKTLNPQKGHRFLPYIVVIVDEFADLIMTSGKEVEMPIARLAQMARAVGIHVILATQRPTTNVITGIIKANFPARIAFKVTSSIDSRTILDTTGAQQLIGKGDMLISAGSTTERVQCAFIDTPEVNEICEYISSQPGYPTAFLLPEPLEIDDSDDMHSSGGVSFGDRDPLFDEIARTVVSSNRASTSSLQRRYSIGYNRAGKIMDQLEAAGIVGPSQGGRPRDVLVDPAGLETILNSL